MNHPLQVSITCPLVVDRMKMLLWLTILYVMITRVLASVLRSHTGADRWGWKARAVSSLGCHHDTTQVVR
jgi:hypothetical protein